MAIKAVIFDLDGTLIEFKFRVREAKQKVIEFLEGEEIAGLSVSDSTMAMLDKAREIRPEAFASLRERVFSIFEEYEEEGFKKSKTRDGAMEALNALKKAGIKMALVTNAGKVPMERALTRLKLTRYFSVIITRDDVSRIKPDGEGIKRALFYLQVEKNEAVFVGDSVIDMRAARDAEVKYIAIKGGASQEQDLKREKPLMLIEELKELPDVVCKPSR